MSERKLTGCFKYGCLGCLSLIALAVVMIFLFGAVHISMDTEPVLEQKELAQELPTPPIPPRAQHLEASPAISGTPFAPDAPAMPRRIEIRPKTGRIVLDVTAIDFTIRPGPAGEPIRVEADYDSNGFRLAKSFETRSDGSWVYTLDFKPKGGWLGTILRGGNQSNNELVLVIPKGQPIELTGSIGIGESNMDLGGLWIESVDLDIGIGDHFLEISQPTPEPIGSFQIDSSLGELELRRLGNGSPASITVEHSIGELFLDLKGDWRNDSAVEVEFGIGECQLWLPEQTYIDLDSSGVSIGEKSIDLQDDADIPADAPTLTLNLSGNIGELSVER